jgi:tetratricopeptide (TPR) repeat protein
VGAGGAAGARPLGRLAALLLALAAPGAGAALGPFERNHPKAEEGLAALAEGRYEDALRAFGEAKAELPGSLELDYDRAQVLARMGRVGEAKELFARLSRAGPPALQQKSAYNLGNLHAQLSERQEAIAAYRRALALDPADADARHNLEVVLRNLPPPQPPAPDGGTPDGGREDGGPPPDAGREDGGERRDAGADGGPGDGGRSQPGDGGADAGQGDAGQGDGGPGDGGRQDGGGPGDGGPRDGGQDGGEGQGEGQGEGPQPRDAGAGGGEDGGTGSPEEAEQPEPGDGGVPHGGEMSREEAERLLDTLKQSERNLQLWRFQRKKEPRNDEKDW